MFTWVPIYQEISGRLVNLRHDEAQLLHLLKEIKDEGFPMIPLQEKVTSDTTQPLTEIDPFSFFASFNRNLTHSNRVGILSSLKQRWNLSSEVPQDFDG